MTRGSFLHPGGPILPIIPVVPVPPHAGMIP
jgi:hypothetical protein